MPIPLKISAEHILIRDAVVEHVISGSPIPSDLSLITEWLGSEGYQELIRSWDENGEDICIEIKHLADKFSDEMMHEYGDIDAEVTITSEMRINHVKKMCTD